MTLTFDQKLAFSSETSIASRLPLCFRSLTGPRLGKMLICHPYQTTNSNRADQHFIGTRRFRFVGHICAVGNHDHSSCHSMITRADKPHKWNAVYTCCLISQENHAVGFISDNLPHGTFMRSTAINFPAKISKNVSNGFCERGRMYD